MQFSASLFPRRTADASWCYYKQTALQVILVIRKPAKSNKRTLPKLQICYFKAEVTVPKARLFTESSWEPRAPSYPLNSSKLKCVPSKRFANKSAKCLFIQRKTVELETFRVFPKAPICLKGKPAELICKAKLIGSNVYPPQSYTLILLSLNNSKEGRCICAKREWLFLNNWILSQDLTSATHMSRNVRKLHRTPFLGGSPAFRVSVYFPQLSVQRLFLLSKKKKITERKTCAQLCHRCFRASRSLLSNCLHVVFLDFVT